MVVEVANKPAYDEGSLMEFIQKFLTPSFGGARGRGRGGGGGDPRPVNVAKLDTRQLEEVNQELKTLKIR